MENILNSFIAFSVIFFLLITLTVFAFLGFSIIKEELKK
jgi:hypothetical protein